MSIRPEFLDLMQREIDGHLSKDEQVRLQNVLKHEAGAREEFENLREVAGILARVKDIDPPGDLKASVMAAVATGRKARKHRFGLFQPRGHVVLRYGYAVAVGVVVGVLIAPLIKGLPWTGAGSTDVVGTVAPPGTGEQTTHLAQLPLEFDGGFGTARLVRTISGFSIHIGLDVQTETPVALLFDEERLDLVGFDRKRGHGEGFSVSQGEIGWVQAGSGEIEFHLAPLLDEATEVRLQVGTGDSALDEVIRMPQR